MRPLGILAIITGLATVWTVISGSPGFFAPLVWLGLLWLPGNLLLSTRSSLEDSVFLPLALSPLLLGILGSLCWGFGLPLAAPLVLMLVFSAFLVCRRQFEPFDITRAQAWVFLLGIALVFIAMAPALFQEGLRLRDDARLHIPVIHSVLSTGVPPQNPFLAGESLPYFWFFHVILAVVTQGTGLSPDWVLSLFNGQATVLMLWGVWRWSGRLGMSTQSRALSMVFLAFGLSPQGWMRLLLAQAQHPELNWNLIQANGVMALFPILSPEDPRLAATFTKVAISNALPFGIGTGVIALSYRPVHFRDWMMQTLLLLASVGTHMAIGILMLMGRGAHALFSWLLKTERGTEFLRAFLQVVLVAAITAPYLWLVVSGRESGAQRFGFFIERALDLQVSQLGLWLLALPAIVMAYRKQERQILALVLTILPAAIFPVFVKLIDGNEYKTVFFALPLLALLAGSGLGRLAVGRLTPLLLLVLLFLPTSYLTGRAYLDEVLPGTLLGDQRASFEEMREHLPENAVIYSFPTNQAYANHTIHLARSNYVSDIYALQIMGMGNHPVLRSRQQAIWKPTGNRSRGLAQALASAQREVGRPLFLLISPSDRRLYPALSDLREPQLELIQERENWHLVRFRNSGP